MKSIRSIIRLSVVAMAAILMSGCGVTLSAGGSMPSDDLYSVNSRQAIAKRETEKAELAKQQALARKAQYEAAIAEAEAEAAARRLDEANGLADGSTQGEYERRLRGFDSPVYVIPQSYYTYSDLYWDLTFNWNWYWGWNTPFYYSAWRYPSYNWNMGWGWTSPHFGYNWCWNDPWYGWNNPWWGGGHHHYPSWSAPSYNVNYRPNYGSSYNNGTTIAGRPSSWTDGNRTPSTGSYNNNNSYRKPNSTTNKTNNNSRPSYRPSREENNNSNNNNNNTYTRPSYNQPSYSSPSNGSSWGGGSSSGGGGGYSRPSTPSSTNR